MLRNLKKLMLDNNGDENISKMIWVCIVFLVAAILLLMITSAFENEIKAWYKSVIGSWFDESGLNGKHSLTGSGTGAGGSGGSGGGSGGSGGGSGSGGSSTSGDHGFLGDIISF